jgi:hypothetical protein
MIQGGDTNHGNTRRNFPSTTHHVSLKYNSGQKLTANLHEAQKKEENQFLFLEGGLFY